MLEPPIEIAGSDFQGGGKMGFNSSYKARQFNLSGLNGISDQTLEMHFKLYEGYVKETNNLSEKISEFLADGKVDQEEMPAYSELTRRLGFEYNGMVLHEYYFENMKRAGTGDPDKASRFLQSAEKSFGSYEIWKADFMGVGKMRGVGWAICYENPANGRISNHWITLHETGNVTGFNPLLVMDVWEHAYLLDYKPADRPKYIEAFFSNIAWNIVDQRLTAGKASKNQTA
ncbi:MAG: superoxide dismutase, Fe-Mn family [Acidobacteriota bacterium]|nr:superoxide dismutase, Fe-Mn family [Acidobacteriota bacterium]